jgi:hypothetical protein
MNELHKRIAAHEAHARFLFNVDHAAETLTESGHDIDADYVRALVKRHLDLLDILYKRKHRTKIDAQANDPT